MSTTRCCEPARAHTCLGWSADDRVAVPELLGVIRIARSRGGSRTVEFDVIRPPIAGGNRRVEARVTPLRGRVILVIADDVTDARRLDAVRRDFVANVSHELKTPTGALSLLAEAVSDASDDPEAVRRFSARMLHESRRLSEMVTELIELSRVQDAEPLPGEVVEVEFIVAEAIDSTRLAADTKSISVTVSEGAHAVVRGDRGQLVAALRNLLANAIAYSPTHTRVAVGVKESDGFVEISVTDQGMGIPHDDIERIFERFYRVDAARSRDTGGTGLGLAIVKHVCANHGGEVRVWSREGEGSTFTVRLPALDPSDQSRPVNRVSNADPEQPTQLVSEVSP